MGKKRDLANEHVIDLVFRLVHFMKLYVGSGNCPYKFDLSDAENIKMPPKCKDCSSCKKKFWTDLESNLLEKYVVK